MKKKIIVLTTSILVSLFFISEVLSQSGLSDDMKGYRKWIRINAQVLLPNLSTGHPGFKDVYLNETNPKSILDSNNNFILPLNEGTIFVKESRKRKQKAIRNISELTTMRKAPGNDNTGGWEFQVFKKTKKGFMEMPIDPVANCFTCHTGAKDNDFLFTKFTNLSALK